MAFKRMDQDADRPITLRELLAFMGSYRALEILSGGLSSVDRNRRPRLYKLGLLHSFKRHPDDLNMAQTEDGVEYSPGDLVKAGVCTRAVLSVDADGNIMLRRKGTASPYGVSMPLNLAPCLQSYLHVLAMQHYIDLGLERRFAATVAPPGHLPGMPAMMLGSARHGTRIMVAVPSNNDKDRHHIQDRHCAVVCTAQTDLKKGQFVAVSLDLRSVRPMTSPRDDYEAMSRLLVDSSMGSDPEEVRGYLEAYGAGPATIRRVLASVDPADPTDDGATPDNLVDEAPPPALDVDDAWRRGEHGVLMGLSFVYEPTGTEIADVVSFDLKREELWHVVRDGDGRVLRDGSSPRMRRLTGRFTVKLGD